MFCNWVSGVGTPCQAHIIIETYFRECNAYFRIVEFSGVGTACLPDIIVDTYSREYNACFRTIRLRLAAPNP